MTKNNLKVVSQTTKEQELKSKSLEAAISQIDQSFGKGSVMRQSATSLGRRGISTGS